MDNFDMKLNDLRKDGVVEFHTLLKIFLVRMFSRKYWYLNEKQMKWIGPFNSLLDLISDHGEAGTHGDI